MDELIKAKQLEQKQREAALAAHRAKNKVFGSGTINCIDCEDEIPPVRRQVCPGTTRCFDCQTQFERRQR